MRNCASSSTSLHLKGLSLLPPSSPDIPDTMGRSETRLPLMDKILPFTKSTWLDDIADLFVMLCSFLFTTTSIVLVALVFHLQTAASLEYLPFIPRKTLSNLQRVISALSVTITSAVIMVVGKRYVFFKLARGGLRSRRVAVYSNPSIGNLASYLISHGVEFPLVCLSAFWGLALATSLTVNDSWQEGPLTVMVHIPIPFGPFDPATPGSSWIIPAAEQLNFAMSSLCLRIPGAVGLINITSTNVATDHSMGVVYYPPVLGLTVGFSFSTALNGFNISMEPLSSVPSTAQNHTCAPNDIDTPFMLWSDGSDSQTLSIIATSPSDSSSIFRFNATAIIMGGTLFSTGDYTEFALNGTSWPNVMPNNSQWAQDITTLICATTFSLNGACSGSSFSDFASLLNTDFQSIGGDDPYSHWSTVLSIAVGAYSSVMPLHAEYDVQSTLYGVRFTSKYGIYILILHIVASLLVLIVVVRLRLASRLSADFMNATRLLLDPLKDSELFNASLKTTIDTLEDPYLLVRDDEFLLAERKSTREKGTWITMFSLRNLFGRKFK
ncbi:hypothetical protein JVT61DRAFT_997 [Boletus reticuloceps]|uniref:Transmembrane protein n=1 Tax=Boletus reticuloceps TaxID=495285 RepID=A0A8I2YRQ3_9AGAM|nr:hypothetical protein JVT61DRAFT_997 [Boletus reticuloceps]